jgi:hypothetical protein
VSFDGYEWASTTTSRPAAGPCEKCNHRSDRQVLIRGPRGMEWRCARCHHRTAVALPFDPRKAPEGREEGNLAIDTLAIYAPIFAPLDRGILYSILRAYFTSGWCVRDVLYAMDHRPSGDSHYESGIAWSRGEPGDKTLARLRDRLWTWRWRDEGSPDRDDIMQGHYTAMRTAMETRRAELLTRQRDRIAEWQQQDQDARRAHDRGASAGARRAAAVAAVQARQERVQGDARESDHRAKQVTEARSPYGSESEDDAPA